VGILIVCVTLLRSAELIIEGTLGVIGEGQRRLASDDGRGLLTHLLPLQITFEGIKKEPVVRNGKPTEHRLEARKGKKKTRRYPYQ
jgi:hypothetical protein